MFNSVVSGEPGRQCLGILRIRPSFRCLPPRRAHLAQEDADHLRGFTDTWIREGLRRNLPCRGLFHFILVHSSIRDKDGELD